MLRPPRPSAVSTSSSAVDALADVAGDRDGLGPGGGDLVDDVGFVQRGGDVVDDDRRARPRQADGLRAAEARGRARHHRDVSGEVGRGDSLVVNL